MLLERVSYLSCGHGADGRASPERVKVGDKRAQGFELAHAALVRRRHAWPREVAPTSGRPIAQKGTKTPVAASVNTNGLPCSRTRRSIHLAHREDAWGHRELVQMQWAFASFASRFPAAR